MARDDSNAYVDNWESFISSTLGVVLPILLAMIAINLRVFDNYDSNDQALLWTGLGLLALYFVYEGYCLMKYEKGKAMIRRVAGFVSMLFIIISIGILADDSQAGNLINDVLFDLHSATKSGESTVTTNLPNMTAEYDSDAKKLFHADCGNNTMTPSFLDFGVSGTRMSSGLFMIGFTIAAVASVTLIKEEIKSESPTYKYPELRGGITFFVTLAMLAFGFTTAGLNWSRLPEHPEDLGYTVTRSNNIYDSRELIHGMLGLFLLFTLAHDLVTYAARYGNDKMDVSILNMTVMGLSTVCTFLALIGVGMMMNTPETSDLADRIHQIGASLSTKSEATLAELKNFTRDVPPSVMVCTETVFDDYQAASVLLSFVVPSALLHSWRAIYSMGIMEPTEE
jgi:hypothetical protein